MFGDDMNGLEFKFTHIKLQRDCVFISCNTVFTKKIKTSCNIFFLRKNTFEKIIMIIFFLCMHLTLDLLKLC